MKVSFGLQNESIARLAQALPPRRPGSRLSSFSKLLRRVSSVRNHVAIYRNDATLANLSAQAQN